MNNKHVEFALGLWVKKQKGYQLASDHSCWDYFDETRLGKMTPTIDHPFVHLIVKGLDAKKLDLYLEHLEILLGILPDGEPGVNYVFDKNLIAIHTATVPQILEALYEALND